MSSIKRKSDLQNSEIRSEIKSANFTFTPEEYSVVCIVPGFSRETESIGSVYVQKEIHVGELAPMIMETGEPTSAPQGQAVARRADRAVLVPCTGGPRDPEK